MWLSDESRNKTWLNRRSQLKESKIHLKTEKWAQIVLVEIRLNLREFKDFFQMKKNNSNLKCYLNCWQTLILIFF